MKILDLLEASLFPNKELFSVNLSKLNWEPLTSKELYDFLENDTDLVELWRISKKNLPLKAELQIPPEHISGLKDHIDEIIEYYNEFDIWLKAKFKMKVVDFIDYDAGKVYLFKPSSYRV